MVRYLPFKTTKKIVEGAIFAVSEKTAGIVKRLTAVGSSFCLPPPKGGKRVFEGKNVEAEKYKKA